MNKTNLLWPILRLKGFMLVNRVIYYFKRLPLIGKIMPDAAYSFGDIKTFVSIVMTLFKGAYHLFAKALYLFLAVLVPVMFIVEDLSKDAQRAGFFTILTFLSLFIGSLIKNGLTSNDIDKYLFIKLMRMPAKQYLLCRFFLSQAGEFFFFLPSVLIFSSLLGGSLLSGLQFTLLIVFFHSIGEGLLLFIWNKTKVCLAQKWQFALPITIIGLLGGYLPVFLATSQKNGLSFLMSTEKIVLSLPFFLITAILFVFSVLYITRYNRYHLLASEIIRTDTLAVNQEKAVQQARFADVQLKESDLAQSKTLPGKVNHKTGYEYLNAIFFARHRRMLVKPILIRLGIIAAAFLIILIVMLIKPQLSSYIGTWISERSLPLFVFVMYCISIGDRVCRAMFNNCDISLLRYGYYREPAVLMKNFKIRLFTLSRLNFSLAAAICLAVWIVVAVSGVGWNPVDMLLYFLCILCLSLFFSVHYLFLYYVFQPYTTDLQMKNPFFTMINTGVYILCYTCLQLDGTPKTFTTIVLAITVVYIVVALWAVKRFAPKSFRVK